MGCSQVHGVAKSETTERLHFHFSLSCIGEGNGNPVQCSCLENPRDRRASRAAVYGAAQSWTWLNRLSSSSSLISYPWLHPLIVSSLFQLTMFYSSSSEFSVVSLHCHFNIATQLSLHPPGFWCVKANTSPPGDRVSHLSWLTPPGVQFWGGTSSHLPWHIAGRSAWNVLRMTDPSQQCTFFFFS